MGNIALSYDKAFNMQDITELNFDEIEEVGGGNPWISRAVTAGLVVVGVGTGVALVAGIAVGVAIVAYDHYH